MYCLLNFFKGIEGNCDLYKYLEDPGLMPVLSTVMKQVGISNKLFHLFCENSFHIMHHKLHNFLFLYSLVVKQPVKMVDIVSSFKRR